MKHTSLLLLAGFFVPVTAAGDAAAPENRTLAVRRGLETARRFAGEGWHQREGVWSGPVPIGDFKLIPFYFLKNHEYVILFTQRPAQAKLDLSLLSGDGARIDVAPVTESGGTAWSLKPPQSGRYFLKFSQPSTTEPSAVEASVVCLYK